MTGMVERICGVEEREPVSDAGGGGSCEVKASWMPSLGRRPGKRRTAGGPPEDTRSSCLGPCGALVWAFVEATTSRGAAEFKPSWGEREARKALPCLVCMSLSAGKPEGTGGGGGCALKPIPPRPSPTRRAFLSVGAGFHDGVA